MESIKLSNITFQYNDFTVFDTKHTGAGEFDSEMPTGIFMKPKNSNIGLSGNFR